MSFRKGSNSDANVGLIVVTGVTVGLRLSVELDVGMIVAIVVVVVNVVVVGRNARLVGAVVRSRGRSLSLDLFAVEVPVDKKI